MWQFVLSSFRSGFRSRTLLAAFVLGVTLVVVAYLSASFSPRQPQTVALDVGLSGIRFAVVLFAIVLIKELVGREIERRSIVLSLSYPVGRSSYLLGRYFGALGLSALAVLVLGLSLWLVVILAGSNYEQQFRVLLGVPFWVAIAGILVDTAVVAAFTLWISTLSTVGMLPLVLGILFAIAGRALGAVFDYVAKGADGQMDVAARYGPILDVVRWLVPDLSRLDWRAWPMYGVAPENSVLWMSILVSLLFAGTMLALAVFAFSRREFS